MIDHVEAGTVEPCRQVGFGQRHPHGGTDSLTERAGGDFDPRGVCHFGVTRRLAAPLPVRPQLF